MTHQEILKGLKSKEYAPIYFLHGEEPFYLDLISDFIEKKVLSDAEKGFNQTILYGKEIDYQAVLDTANRYPMMSPYQVLIIKEAQEMRTLEMLLPYVQNPVKTTILVIVYKHKSYKKFNTKFGKAVKKQAVLFESKKLYDNKVPDWIMSYLKSKKLIINPRVAGLIGEYLGTDLSKVSNEMDKLALNLEPGTEVTADIVEQQIGISKDYNVFEFQKALAARDAFKANKIVNYFKANERKHPLVMMTGVLYNFFSKVYMLHHLKRKPGADILKVLGLRSNWFLKDYQMAASRYNLQSVENILHLLKEYDLKSKGVDFNATGSEPGALLKEMVYRILQ